MRLLVLGIHRHREDIAPDVEAIDAGAVFVSALRIEDDQPLADRELLLRAASARAALLERATFIAARYGFAASSEADAIARCAPHAARWKQTLEKYGGCVEMTLKVPAAQPRERPDRKNFSSGADYLKALHSSVRGAAVDQALRRAVDEHLTPLCIATRWDQRDGRSLELAALVERSRLDDVAAAGERLREVRVPFLLSGPWPLEVFADADHE